MSASSSKQSPVSVARSLRDQQGVTLVSFLIYVLFGASVLLVCLRVMPIYMENMKIQAILADVGESFASESARANKTSIKQKLTKRFTIDTVNAIKVKDVKIEREGNNWVVDAGYETRVNLVSNIDVVVNFSDNNKVEIPFSK